MKKVLTLFSVTAFAGLGPCAALAYFYRLNGAELTTIEPILTAAAVTGGIGIFLTLALSLTRWWQPRSGVLLGVAGFIFWSLAWLDAPIAVSLVVWLILSISFGLTIAWVVGSNVVTYVGSTMLLAAATAALVVTAEPAAQLRNVSENATETSTSAGKDSGRQANGGDADELLGFATEKPNVYMLVADGFGRLDVMAAMFGSAGWDTQTLSPQLTGFGVELDHDATSNYAETTLSIASMVEGSYPVTPDSAVSVVDSREAASASISGQNEMVRWFKSYGYEYWHAPSGEFGASDCVAAVVNRCLDARTGETQLQKALTELTPFKSVDADDAEGSYPGLTAAEFAAMAVADVSDSGSPRLVFGHIVDPHPPWSRSCSAEFERYVPGGTDQAWDEKFEETYLAEAGCLLAELEITVSKIVAADPDAIIIVQSDHGPAFGIDWDLRLQEWSVLDIWQRFATFRMFRLPENCDTTDPRSSSLINTLPLLQSCVLGEKAQFVDPEAFLTRYSDAPAEQVRFLQNGVLGAACVPDEPPPPAGCRKLSD